MDQLADERVNAVRLDRRVLRYRIEHALYIAARDLSDSTALPLREDVLVETAAIFFPAAFFLLRPFDVVLDEFADRHGGVLRTFLIGRINVLIDLHEFL